MAVASHQRHGVAGLRRVACVVGEDFDQRVDAPGLQARIPTGGQRKRAQNGQDLFGHR
jgi:hypothetical protein